MAPHGGDRRVSRRRLVAIYVTLAALTAAVAAVTISLGQEQKAQPSIAGGYAVSGGAEGCAGGTFDLAQSGEFVSVTNDDETLGGKLRFQGDALTGSVQCAGGEEAELDATVGDGRIAGTLGGDDLTAEFVSDPPEVGAQTRIPGSIAGEYGVTPRSECLGGAFALEGEEPTLEVVEEEEVLGELEYAGGQIHGEVECPAGGTVEVTGEASDRTLDLTLTPVGAEPPVPSGEEEAPGELGATAAAPAAERVTAEQEREFGHTLAIFFVAVAVVMLAARLFGVLAAMVGQPRVMGEVVAGIVLGPTVLGAVLPDLQSAIFPTDIVSVIGVVANLGLIFYMFLVGLELDSRQLKGRIGQAAAISNASVALPMMLGLAVAVPLYGLVGPDEKFVAFALFIGVAMSITAFPVLARILVERRMLKRPVGALTLACAAIDDVTAWFLIALAVAVAVAGSGTEVIETIVLAILFCLVMGLAVRPLLGRVSAAYDEAGRVPSGWIVAIFAGILLSAYTTETIGIALIFGAFVMGMIMPRHAELTEDVTHRIEDFVVTLLLPLFFAFIGLRTNIGLLDRPELIALTLALIAIAIVGKLLGAAIAARLTGFDWRSSAVIGTLMNTRGLTELIVLNLALEAGVISQALFAMLVLMALVTTFMAGPLLRLLDPRNELGAPVEEEIEEAGERSSAEFPGLAVPERAVLLAPQTETGLTQLVGLAEPLARAEPPRELILARLLRPARGAAVRGGLQTENKLLSEASGDITGVRLGLIERGVAARAVAFISPDPGADLTRLARSEDVDLLLIDGRRPLVGEGVPRGDVGAVLRDVPCDVAVLVAKEGTDVSPGPDAPVVVPFGGAEHDWAALELGAWIASATGAPLRLLGAAGQTDEGTRITRMLGDAGLLLQQFAGISAEPLVAEPGREGILEAASGAGLLSIGLSERWRQEGLGPTRSEIAKAAPAPVLFVRRGTRPGALAPREDVTRFTWSVPGGPPPVSA